jgi:hypothetical protein
VATLSFLICPATVISRIYAHVLTYPLHQPYLYYPTTSSPREFSSHLYLLTPHHLISQASRSISRNSLLSLASRTNVVSWPPSFHTSAPCGLWSSPRHPLILICRTHFPHLEVPRSLGAPPRAAPGLFQARTLLPSCSLTQTSATLQLPYMLLALAKCWPCVLHCRAPCDR